jgi:hypothetical protein
VPYPEPYRYRDTYPASLRNIASSDPIAIYCTTFFVLDAFSPVVTLDSPEVEEEEEPVALQSGELLLPDVPLHEPGQSLHQLGRTVRRQVGKLLPKLGSKPTKKYKEKPATSAC